MSGDVTRIGIPVTMTRRATAIRHRGCLILVRCGLFVRDRVAPPGRTTPRSSQGYAASLVAIAFRRSTPNSR
jgi:hypothetical protein